jgi:hypothetical protein
MSTPVPSEPLHDVSVQRIPLKVLDRSRRHIEELSREFEFIAESGGEDNTPARLLALVEKLRLRFAGLNETAEAELDAALEQGLESLDLVYRLPPAAAEASAQLDTMLDEADEFCREGDLLTLATPPDQLAFRRWFLHEFVTQLTGGAPTPWPGPLD